MGVIVVCGCDHGFNGKIVDVIMDVIVVLVGRL